MSRPTSLNDSMLIVGTAHNPDWSIQRAVMWRHGRVIDLHSRIVSVSGVSGRRLPNLVYAPAINNSGQIAAESYIADEFAMLAVRLTPVDHPAGDVNVDGHVDHADLQLVLEGWSSPMGSPGCDGHWPCMGDVNVDGVVDGVDLGLVLATWTSAKDR